MLAPRNLLRAIAAAALLSTVGCSYPYMYCAPDDCGPCGPQICTDACTDCGEIGCTEISGNGPCGKPARGLFSHLGYMATCGGGCGEFYIHPWINERPDECDPCDNHGNWIGPQACCDGFWGSFWGRGCGGACGDCYGAPAAPAPCGCGSCGGGAPPVYDEHVAPPEVILPGEAEPIESGVPARALNRASEAAGKGVIPR